MATYIDVSGLVLGALSSAPATGTSPRFWNSNNTSRLIQFTNGVSVPLPTTTLNATNISNPFVTWAGPTNLLNVNGGKWKYVMTTAVAVTNFTWSGSDVLLSLSNSTGGALPL